jgi:hypothetical protein
LLGLVLLLGLAGCQPPVPPPIGVGGLPTFTPGGPAPTPTAARLPADARAAVDTALADLARRLGVDSATITLTSVAPTTWASVDAMRCLGVQPVALRRAAQPVPGYIITFHHAEQIYIYHAGAGQVVYCDPAVMQPPPP